MTLLALDEARGHTPGYALLVECAADAPRGALQRDLADQVEKALQGISITSWLAIWGSCSLPPVPCHVHARPHLAQCRERGMIEGNIKIEPLRTGPARRPPPWRQALDVV